ncbi:LysE family translocator [Streptomyces sp. NPDC007901]|uniref:LysE family translocator n=1 Tax=Streptomyces sp. NPDC007901 TaxID=3364785 RepID=UPI0036EEA272
MSPSWTPGADWAYVIAAGVRGRSVVRAVAGLMAGYAPHTAPTVAGLAVLLANSPALLTVLTVAGAGYLVWLGWGGAATPGGTHGRGGGGGGARRAGGLLARRGDQRPEPQGPAALPVRAPPVPGHPVRPPAHSPPDGRARHPPHGLPHRRPPDRRHPRGRRCRASAPCC